MESQVASDEVHQLRVPSSVWNQTHPTSSFGALKGIWQSRLWLSRGSFVPVPFYDRPVQLCSFNPGNLLVAAGFLSLKGLVMNLNCRWREAAPDCDKEAPGALQSCPPDSHHKHQLTEALLCPHLCPPESDDVAIPVGLLARLRLYGFHLSCGNKAGSQKVVSVPPALTQVNWCLDTGEKSFEFSFMVEKTFGFIKNRSKRYV